MRCKTTLYQPGLMLETGNDACSQGVLRTFTSRGMATPCNNTNNHTRRTRNAPLRPWQRVTGYSTRAIQPREDFATRGIVKREPTPAHDDKTYNRRHRKETTSDSNRDEVEKSSAGEKKESQRIKAPSILIDWPRARAVQVSSHSTSLLKIIGHISSDTLCSIGKGRRTKRTEHTAKYTRQRKTKLVVKKMRTERK